MRNSLSEEELRETLKVWREEGYSKRATGKRMGFARNAIRNRLKKARELNLVLPEDLNHIGTPPNRKSPKANRRKVAKTDLGTVKLDALIDQERLDHAKIVRSGVARLAVDECIYDDVFRRDLSITNERWKHVRDLDEFRNCQVLLPNKKRVWCHPDARDDLMRLDGVRGV